MSTKTITEKDAEESLISEFFKKYEDAENIPENEVFCLISLKWLLDWSKGVDIKISDRYFFAHTLPKEILTQVRERMVVSNKSKRKELSASNIEETNNTTGYKYTSVPLSNYPSKEKLERKKEKRRRGERNAKRRENLRKLFEKRAYYRENMPKIYSDISGDLYEDAFILLSNGTKSTETSFLTIKNGTSARKYAIIPLAVWEYFAKTYGVEGDKGPIKRAFNPAIKAVEVYPLSMSFYDPTDDTTKKKVRLFASKTAKFGSLRSELSSFYGNEECKDVRIWLGSNMYMRLDEKYDRKAIESIVNINGSELVIELYNKADEVKEPLSVGKLFVSFWHVLAAIIAAIMCMLGFDMGDHDAKQEPGTPQRLLREGVCGLSNLGNTCYMNSALQCLSNTPSLATYFMSDEYKEELNLDAVFGTKGKVTEAFANLIRRMWDKTNRYCSPSSFRRIFAEWNKDFSGYYQQDAHEFLSKLLDNIHEDLNHVKSKPVIEDVSSDGTLVEAEVAKESWENCLKRDDSVIVSEFYGQMRSESSCNTCGKKSITFSSFSSLSLPLPPPPPTNYLIKCTVVFKDEIIPVKYGFEVPEVPAPLVRDIRIKLEVLTGKSKIHLVLLSKYGSVVPDTRHVPRDTELIFYEVDENVEMKLPMLFIENVVEEDKDDEDDDDKEDKKKENEDEKFVKTSTIGFPSLIQLNATNEKEDSEVTKKEDEDNEDEDEDEDENEEIGTVLSVSDLYEKIWEKEKRKVPEVAKSFDGKYPFVVYGLNKDKSIKKLEMDEDVDLQEFVHVPGGVSKFELHWEKDLFANNEDDIHDMFKGVVFDESFKELDNKRQDIPDLTLDSCMKLFTSEEELEGEERWNCGNCGEDVTNVTSKKKVDIWKLPNRLIVHLNRFKIEDGREAKLTQPIHFEVDSWDLSQYVLDPEAAGVPQKYRLYALISHKGVSSRHGHYVAYARNRINGRWYIFNDANCTEVDVASVKEAETYVLFYERIEEEKEVTEKIEEIEEESKTAKN